MSLLSPALMQRLARSKFNVRQAVASSGVGERRSRAKGSGIEFAEHRPYQLGDDIRYIDQHVFARLGEHHIRQFSLYQQLQVTILLDMSASMRFGEPVKFDFAKQISAALAYIALAGGDNVQVAAFSGERLQWSAAYHGVRRAPELFHWLDTLVPEAHTNLTKTVRLSMGKLKTESLLIIVSDWLVPDLEAALKTLDLKRQELIAVQILSPEEEEPERLGSGELRLLDTETGQEMELSFDKALLERYHENLENWTRSVQSTVRKHQGHFVRVRSDANLEQLLIRDWRTAGLIV